MTHLRRFGIVLALAMLLILTTFLSGCTGFGGMARDATNTGIETAKAWYEREGKALVKSEGAALLAEGQALMLERGRAYTDAQVARLSASFAGHGVDASKIDSITAGLKAIRDVQEEERKTGKPYQPITGNLVTDVIAAYLASKAGIRGASLLAEKKPKPAPPPA